ncbi:sulfotransferase [Azospirillum sp. A26]|uniref:sulfotransferase n=1 Tax=Azospirillum sp. A26 TaxID=3160607 RepID=UPI00366C1C1B
MEKRFEMGPEIFIIGHARSGTTVLTHILNTDPEICILQEAEIYWYQNVSHYADVFNRRGLQRKRTWQKGHYVPPGVPNHVTGKQVLSELSKYYRRVGDKVALGPSRTEQMAIWDFFARNYFSATYIFTFRNPLQATISMRRMFPGNSYTEILDTWIMSVALMMRFMSFLPNVCAIPMERYSERVFHSLNERLGTNAVISGAAIHEANQFDRSALPDLMEEEDEKLIKCETIYKNLIDAWDEKNLSFYSASNLYSYFGDTFRDLDAAFSPSVEAEVNGFGRVNPALIDPRRAVLAAYAQTPLALPDWQKAAESYVTDFPNDGFGHYIFAIMLYQNSPSDCERALTEFDAAENCGYVPFWVKYNRAYVYKMLGNHAQATQDMREALLLNPDHADAQKMLALWTA